MRDHCTQLICALNRMMWISIAFVPTGTLPVSFENATIRVVCLPVSSEESRKLINVRAPVDQVFNKRKTCRINRGVE
jgi:hypothetical protein